MDTIKINPLVVSIASPDTRLMTTTMLTPINPTKHGGIIKTVIAVAVAVIIPIAAPAITSAIASSGVLGATVSTALQTSTLAATAGSAVVGAGLGAVSAKVQGKDVKAGALTGAIGGGIGGYTAAINTPGAGIPAMSASDQLANVADFKLPLTGAGADTGLQIGSNEPIPPEAGLDVTNASMNVDDAAVNVVDETGAATGATALNNVAGEGTKAAAETTLTKGLSETLLDKVTAPETLATMALQAGGVALGTALVPETEVPPGMETTFEEFTAEIEAIKNTNEELFNEKMEAAKEFLIQAGYYDPTYFASQAANQAAIAEGRKMKEWQEAAGLKTGGWSTGEQRRAALAGSGNIQSAYDKGFLQGVGLRDTSLKTAYGIMPNAADTTAMNAYADLYDFYQKDYASQVASDDAKRAGISSWFNQLNVNKGQTDAEKKEQEAILASANPLVVNEDDEEENKPNSLTDGWSIQA